MRSSVCVLNVWYQVTLFNLFCWINCVGPLIRDEDTLMPYELLWSTQNARYSPFFSRDVRLLTSKQLPTFVLGADGVFLIELSFSTCRSLYITTWDLYSHVCLSLSQCLQHYHGFKQNLFCSRLLEKSLFTSRAEPSLGSGNSRAILHLRISRIEEPSPLKVPIALSYFAESIVPQ